MKPITRRDFIRKTISTSAALGISSLFPAGLSAEAASDPIPDVAVVTDGKVYKLVRKAIELLGGIEKFVSKGDIVVVKPNIGWDRNPQQAATTNPWVVAEIVKMCLEAGAKKVKVFDRPCNTAARCYKNSGIEKRASEAGAEVSYTVDAGFVKMNFPEGEKLKSWHMYKPAIEADVFINVPIAKHHGLTKVTLGIKNLMGIMGKDRGKLHLNISKKMPDVAKFVKPQLTVIDAVRLLTKNGPQGGKLKDVTYAGTIVAGTTIATVDAYAATLHGREPSKLSMLTRASELGLGEIDLKKVNIKKVSLKT